MNRVKKITLFNMPCERREIELSLDAARNILVLTGFNGIGKSRVLSSILELMSLVHDIDYGDWNEEWIIRLEFEGGHVFHSLKINPSGAVKQKDWEKTVQRILQHPKPLHLMFSSALDAIVDAKGRKGFSSKNSDDDNDVYCALQLKSSNGGSVDFTSGLKAVGFINDRVVFGYKRESEDTVFGRKELEGSLDKTLYVLIKDFISAEAVKPDLETEIDNYINEYLSIHDGADKVKDQLLADTKNYVLDKMRHRNAFVKDEIKFSSNPMFLAINNIFAMTGRKLVWRDTHIGVELRGGKFVQWSSLSRGEKTLLALFLLVYLHRDGALFILDEPDLSLHMEWQKKLLPSLIQLAPSCQFIIATHSPFLVMNTGREQVVNMAKLVAQVE